MSTIEIVIITVPLLLGAFAFVGIGIYAYCRTREPIGDQFNI